jgi:formate dehydrogenase subunit gamma
VSAAVAAPVLRFTGTERLLHWAVALPFLTATVTGLLLGFGPDVGITVDHYAVRRIHIVAGLLVVALPLLVTAAGLATPGRGRLRETLRSLGSGGRGAGPSFSRGQQVFAALVVAGAVLSLVSGVELWQWHWFSREARQGALALHQALGFGFAAAILGHLYLAAVHPRTRWRLPAVFTGRVPAERMHEDRP